MHAHVKTIPTDGILSKRVVIKKKCFVLDQTPGEQFNILNKTLKKTVVTCASLRSK